MLNGHSNKVGSLAYQIDGCIHHMREEKGSVSNLNDVNGAQTGTALAARSAEI